MQMEMHIMVNGNMVKSMDLESKHWTMESRMKVVGSMIRSMVRVYRSILTELYTMEIGIRTNSMEKE